MVNMNTPYDDAFRTLLTDCSKLIIPVVNEIFHEHYTGRETVVLKQNEIFLKYPENEQEERITDTSFTIMGSNRNQHYHIECQSTPDGSMIIRMYEYDSQIALKEGKLINNTLEINFPQSAVLYLRHSSNTPDKLRTIINTPGGSITYDVPIIKVKLYDIDKIL